MVDAAALGVPVTHARWQAAQARGAVTGTVLIGENQQLAGVLGEILHNGGAFAERRGQRTLRSPYDHERMLPFFDNGDHVHPNDKGMQAMADAVDLKDIDCRVMPA